MVIKKSLEKQMRAGTIRIAILFVIVLFAVGCYQRKIRICNDSDKTTVLDTSQYRDMLNDSLKSCFVISDKEKHLADSILVRYLNEKRDSLSGRFRKSGPDIFKEYKSYYRQYVGLVHAGGDKYILVNFVHKNVLYRHKSWKTNLVFVFDGGSYYWRGLIDISSKKCLMVRINGVA